MELLTASFNQVETLVPCVRATARLAQGGGRGGWEHHIVEGGSTDGTRGALTAWGARHPALRVTQLTAVPGRNAEAAAWNEAIGRAASHWVAIVRPEARLLPDAVAAVFRLLARYPALEVVVPDVQSVDADAPGRVVETLRARHLMATGVAPLVFVTLNAALKAGPFDEGLEAQADGSWSAEWTRRLLATVPRHTAFALPLTLAQIAAGPPGRIGDQPAGQPQPKGKFDAQVLLGPAARLVRAGLDRLR
jgi:hypothetical protein